MSRWYELAKAAHNDALAAPQRFPLTGDGDRTERLTSPAIWAETNGRPVPRTSAAEIAAARYRDWARGRGQ